MEAELNGSISIGENCAGLHWVPSFPLDLSGGGRKDLATSAKALILRGMWDM